MARSPRSPSPGIIPLAQRRAMEWERAADGKVVFEFEYYRVVLENSTGAWMVDLVSEVIGDGGVCVQIYTPEEFAEAVEDGQDIMNNAMEWANG
jgi:hypothetical protein